MPSLADLVGRDALDTPDRPPAVMAATILDGGPRVRVRVPALDGGRHALDAFGTYGKLVASVWRTMRPGDEVRVSLDEFGGLVIVAWEPTGA